MAITIPKELDREEYFDLCQKERKRLWTKFISENMEISEEEAERIIDRNNSKPLCEDIDHNGYTVSSIESEYHQNHIPPGCQRVFTRPNANAMLLAQSSKAYCGPLGPRPIFVSLKNIAKISLLNEDSRKVDNLCKILSRDWYTPTDVLIELKLTASNPRWAPEGVEFSSEDLKRGICIPSVLNMQIMRALGIIYARGHISKDLNILGIAPKMEDKEFYETVVTGVMERAFNLFQDEIHTCSQTSPFSGKQYDTLRLSYVSKAIATYLLNNINFPSSENEKRETGISEKIKSNKHIREFLNYYLACDVRFRNSESDQNISICINDTSKPVLKDIQEILFNELQNHSISLTTFKNDSYRLVINTIPTYELYFSGYLNENPRIRGTLENNLNRNGISKIPFKYLYERFGERVVPYRRERMRV